jgi:recombinational DNA repair protein RecR
LKKNYNNEKILIPYSFGNLQPTDFSLEKKDFEVIICTSYNADGIFTASVVKEKIREKFGKDIIITTFGRGFSSGTELEYADGETLRYALENKTYL